MKRQYVAEALGTMVLVLAGCGAAVFNGGAATTAAVLTIASAFGLSVVAMAYTIGPVSGCHINPAITLGVWLSGRMKSVDALVHGRADRGRSSGFRDSLGRGARRTRGPGRDDDGGERLCGRKSSSGTGRRDVLYVRVRAGGARCDRCEAGAGDFAGLVIGLTLVLVHIVCIPVTGTSVNPARSIAPALFEGGEALSQLWVFIAAPFAGAALAAAAWKALSAGRHAGADA